MLHVTTEVGKPGVKEREKRHFPDIHNGPSEPKYKPRGRRYIPHGYGSYDEWKPHPPHINIKYSVNGPDWNSRLMKFIKPVYEQKYPAAEIWPNNWRSIRPYPFTWIRSEKEWLLDPNLTNIGLRCVFNGTHKASLTSDEELTHSMMFGRGRSLPLINQRNGISEISPGDKSYQAVEYSPNFYNLGSTRPVPAFGAHVPCKILHTFVPLKPATATKRETFKEKENSQQKEIEVAMVKKLDEWKPASPLVPIHEEKKW